MSVTHMLSNPYRTLCGRPHNPGMQLTSDPGEITCKQCLRTLGSGHKPVMGDKFIYSSEQRGMIWTAEDKIMAEIPDIWYLEMEYDGEGPDWIGGQYSGGGTDAYETPIVMDARTGRRVCECEDVETAKKIVKEHNDYQRIYDLLHHVHLQANGHMVKTYITDDMAINIYISVGKAREIAKIYEVELTRVKEG